MKNFGFGCMRLAECDGKIDIEQFKKMVDIFMEAGFTYFDTAHGYHGGRSELALHEGLTTRYPRESYILADKLSTDFFTKEDDIRPLFASQLEACGVDYFDYYLLHAQNADYYKKYTACGAYKICVELKKEGKIRHLGISFHDKADVLEMILSEHPEVEVVQIQFNYADYDDPGVEGRRCYEVCRKYGKPVIVMEPVRGGSLANLPDDANEIFNSLNGGSPASYAIRFAASFEGVMMVLSGMSNEAQMRENIGFMKDFAPLNKEERDAIDKVRELFAKQKLIACTGCGYCVDGCPQKINIPKIFACMNAEKQYKNWNSRWYYNVHTKNSGKASDCIQCGKCENACPQKLKIRELLSNIAEAFDK